MAASIGVAPVAFTETMPLPLGRLRLTEATFEVSAVAWDGTPVAQPSVLQVRAPDGTVAWMPSMLAGPVPAPDATPLCRSSPRL